MDNKAIDEARDAVEATPEYKAHEEAKKALEEAKKATPEYKALKEAEEALKEAKKATPEYKALKEAKEALEETPAWKAYRKTWGPVGAIPAYTGYYDEVMKQRRGLNNGNKKYKKEWVSIGVTPTLKPLRTIAEYTKYWEVFKEKETKNGF